MTDDGRDESPAVVGDGPDERSYGREITAVVQSGPIPAPSELRAYEEVLPGTARTIVEAWTEEAAHRRKQEEDGLVSRGASERRAQWLAFSFAVGALGVTAFCAYLDADWAAAIIGGGTIASVTAAFLRTR